jgi:hypothetical protein
MQFELNGLKIALKAIDTIQHDWYEGSLCAFVFLKGIPSRYVVRCNEEEFERLRKTWRDYLSDQTQVKGAAPSAPASHSNHTNHTSPSLDAEV